MSILEPNCFKRKCKHFLGVIQPDGNEMSEKVNCSAFLEGIPDEIAYGTNKHLVPHPDQKNKIVYERAK
jgi:hypothetical protein